MSHKKNLLFIESLIALPFKLYQAYQVTQYDKTSIPWYGKFFAVLFPNYYSAFKVGKHVSGVTPENELAHAFGKFLCPGRYTAYQLSKINNNGKGSLWAILLGHYYGAFASKKAVKGTNQPNATIGPFVNPHNRFSNNLYSPPLINPIPQATPATPVLPTTYANPAMPSPVTQAGFPVRL